MARPQIWLRSHGPPTNLTKTWVPTHKFHSDFSVHPYISLRFRCRLTYFVKTPVFFGLERLFSALAKPIFSFAHFHDPFCRDLPTRAQFCSAHPRSDFRREIVLNIISIYNFFTSSLHVESQDLWRGRLPIATPCNLPSSPKNIKGSKRGAAPLSDKTRSSQSANKKSNNP